MTSTLSEIVFPQGATPASNEARPHFSLAEEACRWMDDRSCHAALTAAPRRYLDCLQHDLIGVAQGILEVTMPPKLLFDDGTDTGGDSGDFRVMPCVVRGPGRVTKTVKVVGSNFRRKTIPGRMTVGRALYLDPVENYVAREFAAFALSSARTGAVAALAHRALALGSERSVTVMGCGAGGWYSAFYLAAEGRIDRLRCVDPDEMRRDACVRSLQQCFPQLRIESALPRDAADADVLVCATDSRLPVADPGTTGARIVISLGADADEQSELPAAWIDAARIHVDHPDSARIGDLQRWAAADGFDVAACLDLGRLLADGRPDASKRDVFVSTGSALLDNLTIEYLIGQAGAAD